ncbi:4298_t:CDS:2 [Funneliformis geosporum]|nr:4298_t:CDS:2 [Funneliformis geosporum]
MKSSSEKNFTRSVLDRNGQNYYGCDEKLCNQVNAYLRIKNGILYLKMAYEEILFPVCFIGRMRKRNKRIPDPNECFSYIVVKDGRKELHRISDFMEYADIAKEQNIEIDINYYLGSTIAICARFINKDDHSHQIE